MTSYNATTAITADLHLREGKPERFGAFTAMLHFLEGQGVKRCVVAGDCFDTDDRSYVQVDSIMEARQGMELIIVPGNHDPHITGNHFSSGNIKVIEESTWETWGAMEVLLLPYHGGETMSRCIQWAMDDRNNGLPDMWMLISHGDFGLAMGQSNGNEKGYFPLTRQDVERWSPRQVVLGHIHQGGPITGRVVYPGSPFPLDHTERGVRHVIIVNHESQSITPVAVPGTPVYHTMTLYLTPGNDLDIHDQVTHNLTALNSADMGQLHLEVNVLGMYEARDSARKLVEEALHQKGISSLTLDLDSLIPAGEDDLYARIFTSSLEELSTWDLDYPLYKTISQSIVMKMLHILEKGRA